MKIINRTPDKTADINAAQGTALRELFRLALIVTLLVIALFFVVAIIVDVVVKNISFETEKRIFSSFSPGKDPTNKEREKLEPVQNTLNELTSNEMVPPLNYRLILISQDKPNAFAFPGGTIGVTTGLLDSLHEKIELAFVLAHELGHFANRDHLRGMGRAIGFQVVLSLLFGGEMGTSSLNNLYNFIVQRGYSRTQEIAADEFGLKLVYNVYGKSSGIETFFRVISDNNKIPEWAYMFTTHPSPEKRIENLKKYAESLTSSEKEKE